MPNELPLKTRVYQPARDFVAAGSPSLTLGVGIGTVPLTIAMWFNPSSLTLASGLFVVGQSGSGNHYRRMFTVATTGVLTVTSRTTASVSATAGGVVAGVWNHCIARFTSSTRRDCALNGVFGTAETTANSPNAPDMTIFGRTAPNDVANYCSGRIMWPFAWNISLSDANARRLTRGVEPWRIEPRYIVSGLDTVNLYDQYQRAKWTSAGTTLATPLRFAQGGIKRSAVNAVTGGGGLLNLRRRMAAA